MMTTEEVKKAGTIEIKYVPITEAIELIQCIRTKKDSLGMEMVDWTEWGDEVIGMVCDLFDIENPEVMEMTGEKPIMLAVDPKWVKKLEDIATVTTEMTKVLTERVDKRTEKEEASK